MSAEATGKAGARPRGDLRTESAREAARTKKPYAPLFHAASHKVRRDLYDGYRVAVFREVAVRLRDGHLTVVFPVGNFPPAFPFVGG